MRRPVTLLVICIAWAAVFALLSGPIRLVPLELAERSLQDLLVRHGVKAATPGDCVLLAVDEASMDLSQLSPEEIEASASLRQMAAGFPWSRAVYAEAIRKVLDAGARVMVLDVHFLAPNTGDDDLRETLDKNRERVVIASVYEDTPAPDGSMTTLYHPPAATVLPHGTLEDGIVGYANFWPETDRVVRGANYRINDGELLRNVSWDGGEHSSLAALALEKAGEKARIPRFGLMRFCEPGSFQTVPLWMIFVPEMWQSNLKDGRFFRDKIVLLGPLASRFRDTFRTPVGSLPGPEIHLHALAAAKENAFYRRATPPAVMATCLLIGLLVFAITLKSKRPLLALGALAGLLAAYTLLAWVLYNTLDLLPGLLTPAATLVFSGLTAFTYDFSVERRERMRTRRSLERYVSRDVVRELLDRHGNALAELGGSRKDVVVLFSDLRDFTKFSEGRDPAELVAYLNEYLGAMVEIVFRHQGTLDKFIGDAVMATWGTILSAGAAEDARRAVAAALDMLAGAARLREKWSGLPHAPDLRLGIGLHAGSAIFGNIGSSLKMEPTVIGDTVNLTSRLESLTKHYRLPILFSGSVVKAAGHAFPFRTVDIVRVVGREAPVTIHTLPLNANYKPEHPAWLTTHEQAWECYRSARFHEAAALFAEVSAATQSQGADEAVSMREMLERCRTLAKNPPGPDWEPVTVMESK